MKQHSYETVLEETVAPPPSPQARVLAKRAALAAFARAQAAEAAPAPRRGFFQGLLGAMRLSRENNSHGDESMSGSNKSRMYAGAASVCLAVVGFAVIWPMIRNDGGAHLLEKAPPESMLPPPPRSEAAVPQPAAAANATDTVQGEAVPVQPIASAKAGAAGAVVREPEIMAPAGTTAALKDPRAQQKDVQTVDAITAEDIGKFPDTSVSEAMQRVPGVVADDGYLPQTRQGALSGQNRSQPIESVTVTGLRGRLVASETKAAAQDKSAAPAAPAARANAGLSYRYGAPGELAEVVPEGRDNFSHFDLNSVHLVSEDPFSTFSADVDTSSYSFVRRQLNAGVLPQKDAVRSEEMLNYFEYAWPAAESRERPFKPTVVVSDSPWGKGRKLIHIGIKGYELDARQRPDANLVLLLDVSGSMSSPDKLPLVKQSMRLMVNGLKASDTVAIVVYAGAAGMVLPPTPAGQKEKIFAALDSLTPGGSTAGAEGIELAYQLAEKSFRKEGVNRILLCTDGDFNVGIDDTNELKGFIERKRSSGIFLSVLGFGEGNYRDELAQALAQNGNGVAAYIDTLGEAQKVLVQEAGASLFTIAKDVKLQVDFNPATVAEYRLVGYETRALKTEDFNNDAVDAGDVGSGHAVTAIYEITPVGVDARMVERSRYANDKASAAASGKKDEYGYLRIRYKLPGSDRSALIEQPIGVAAAPASEAIARDVQFSTAVAGFAQLLRGGQYTGSLGYNDVIKQALAARGDDPYGYRNEFVRLVRNAQSASGQRTHDVRGQQSQDELEEVIQGGRGR